MTRPNHAPTHQETATEHATTELTRRLKTFAPPSLLADPHAFAAAFLRWLDTHNWRSWPRSQTAINAQRPGVPPDTHAHELTDARNACATATANRANNQPDQATP